MKKIAVFGAGGFGQEVTNIWFDMLKARGETFEFLGYFDDVKVGQENRYGKVIGDLHALQQVSEPLEICLAIGKPQTLSKIYESLNNSNIQFPNVIHPSFQQLDPESQQIGQGNILSLDVIFCNSVSIGDFNIFNTRATIGHDVKAGNYNIFSPNVQISGEVKIGDSNFFGFNSGILQRKSVGNGNTLGTGSILLKNIKDDCTYIGNPASKLNF